MDTAATVLSSPETASTQQGSSHRWPYSWLLEAVALLASPPAAFFGLHVARMISPNMIDPYLYTAYAQNGPDLIARYGDHRYYWVRLGFLLPARASYLAFGAVPGFYVLRYVLALVAVIPVYLLFRRLHGRAAGALAVAVALSSPVVLHAWGTDYPDSAVASYLFAGTACLVMPTASRRRRLLWVTVAGVCLSLAVHSQVIAMPLIAAVVVAYAAANLRREPLDVLAHLGILALCALSVTGALAVVAHRAFGSSNIIMPTVDASRHFRTPREIAKWHSTNWRWVLHDPYLLALPTAGASPGSAAAGWVRQRS
jgi:4-amino-4-deoxy-L-arabinose transferase-like glycosyltransferase